MIVRKINSQELKRVQEFCSLAFEYPFKNSELSSEQLLERLTREPHGRQDLYWQSQWAAFEDDDHTMLSTFTVIPYQAHFDGNSMLMMGVGGVATLPQYRKRGGIRLCFEQALPDMYAQGAAFSYLYPFSTTFYRKFGYELACERCRYKLRLSAMPKTPVSGACRLLEPGVMLEDGIRAVYRDWQNRYNLMTIDEDIEYRWVSLANPFRDKEYTYLYQTQDGTPKGFVTYKPVIDEGDRTLECTRFFFTDAEGLHGLLGLLCTLSADHSHITLSLPMEIELGGLLPEWSFGTVRRQLESIGMVRAVDVERVLRMARTRGSGTLAIAITDAQIEQNNDCFGLTFEDGRTTDVRRVSTQPDISLTIQDFSRLICGRYNLSCAQWLPDVALHCDVAKAEKVFYRKPMFITRYF